MGAGTFWLLEWQEGPESLQAWELWQEGFWLWQDSLEPISSERQQSCTDKEMALVRGDPGALLIHPHSLPSLSSTLLFIPPLIELFLSASSQSIPNTPSIYPLNIPTL